MSVTTIEGVPVYEEYTVLIEAKTTAETTALIELRNYINYTFTASTLGAGEEITVDVYDHAKSAWQPMMVDGFRVKLSFGYEQLQISDTTAVIRFNKSATASAVGLVMSHPK